MSSPFPADLQPQLLWKHFHMLTRVPRNSGEEAAVREAIRAWATGLDFKCSVDSAGNLVVLVPATRGHEDRQVTVLQGHLDMVCEKNADVDFNFDTDPIAVRLEGDLVTASGTTLGADNGIGVAAAMAVAEDPDAEHGPLELLFTVDEETGMTGAFNLDPDILEGRRMLNLDTEEVGAIYVGCAGGGDVKTRFVQERTSHPEASCAVLQVKGLVGGHSGLDIHENRANAIKCMGRVLLALEDAKVRFLISSIDCGSKRNAIPREARCAICVLPGMQDYLQEVVDHVQGELKAEFRATDPDLQVTLAQDCECHCDAVFTPDFTRRLVRLLLATPSSVLAMSGDVPGLVETSNNLGVIRTTNQEVELVNCCRSSKGSALEAARRSIQALHVLAGGSVTLEPSYPGWQPDLDSPLLGVARAVHQELFGEPAEIKAVHAGLECGLIGERFKGMDMISIGPDIRGAHSPTERVTVSSVQVFYSHLKCVLAALY